MNSTFPVALFFSYSVKFHFCCELTYVSFWEAFLNSERAFFGCEGRFFSLWCPQPLYKIYLYTYFNKGCFGNRALALKAIVWWSLKQRIALYCVFQWLNPKATFIEIGVYYIHRMVVLTIVAPSNDHTEHPIEKPTYITLLSCSLYNSWYNLKTRQGQLHWLKLEPAKIQNLENCQQDISLYIFFGKTT